MTSSLSKGVLTALAGTACLLLSGCGSEGGTYLAQNPTSQAPSSPSPSGPSAPTGSAPSAQPQPEPLHPRSPPVPPPAPQENVAEVLWRPDLGSLPDDSALIDSTS